MQLAADQVAEWSHLNFMNINTKKTKEMLLGPVLKNPPPPIVFDTGTVDRVATFKLLGVTIMNNLSWEEHVSVISTKASKRIHLKKIKTAETFIND